MKYKTEFVSPTVINILLEPMDADQEEKRREIQKEINRLKKQLDSI